MDSEKRKFIIVGTALALLFVLIFVFNFWQKKESKETGQIPAAEPESPYKGYKIEDLYRPDIPKDAVPTKPIFEAPAAPNVKEKLGIFEMKVGKDGFSPKSITVRKGDLVQIRLTALDNDYDFSMLWMGLYQKVKMGETKDVGFGMNTAGTYIFECRDSCPFGKIKGQVVVLP